MSLPLLKVWILENTLLGIDDMELLAKSMVQLWDRAIGTGLIVGICLNSLLLQSMSFPYVQLQGACTGQLLVSSKPAA